MKRILYAEEAQYLTIQLLLKADLHSEEVKNLMNALSGQMQRKYFQQCLLYAQALRSNPDHIHDFAQVCNAILARQKYERHEIPPKYKEYSEEDRLHAMESSIKKKEHNDALALTTIERLRIERGKSAIRAEQIQKICSGFRDKEKRIFWENNLEMTFTYRVGEEVQKNGVELECLNFLVNWMQKMKPAVFQEMTVIETEQLQLLPSGQEILNAQNFYDYITEQVSQAAKSFDDFLEFDLGIPRSTWYAWRKKTTDGETSESSRKMHRLHVLLIALELNLSLPHTASILCELGYRFRYRDRFEEQIAALLKNQDCSVFRKDAIRNLRTALIEKNGKYAEVTK